MAADVNKMVRELLLEHSIIKPPVPLERIAEEANLRIEYVPLEPDMSGALIESDDGEMIVAVNEVHHRNRKRFTIAHELAHYFLGHHKHHPHVDREFVVIPRNQVSSQAVDPREIDANAFAASLLMPEEFLLKDFVRLGGFDANELSEIAKRYQVSEQALSFRLVNLGFLPPY
jgi:Zn-dependent peptidase ImmA (M78 family)